MPAKYAWVITKDVNPDPKAKPATNDNATGLIGPSNALPLTADEIRTHPKAKRFRMLDDDGTICYYGYLVDETDKNDMDSYAAGDHAFAPLDDFGEPNAGCTKLEYWTTDAGKRHWENIVG